MPKRREGHEGSAWLAQRKRAGRQLYLYRLAAGDGRKPLSLVKFGRRLGTILGTTAYNNSILSKWERAEEDFDATILMAAELAAGLPPSAEDPLP